MLYDVLLSEIISRRCSPQRFIGLCFDAEGSCSLLSLLTSIRPLLLVGSGRSRGCSLNKNEKVTIKCLLRANSKENLLAKRDFGASKHLPSLVWLLVFFGLVCSQNLLPKCSNLLEFNFFWWLFVWPWSAPWSIFCLFPHRVFSPSWAQTW